MLMTPATNLARMFDFSLPGRLPNQPCMNPITVTRWGKCCALLLAMILGLVARVEAADRYRPAYHFLPPANWMNDTMGIHWKGKYHIFYLHNPDAPVWRQATNWAQAYSTDLISSFLPVVTASSGALPLFVFLL